MRAALPLLQGSVTAVIWLVGIIASAVLRIAGPLSALQHDDERDVADTLESHR